MLTAPIFQWGPIFEYFIRQILTEQWNSNEQIWSGIDEGSVVLAPYSSKVELNTRAMVLSAHRTIVDGTKEIFCGNISTNNEIFIHPDDPNYSEDFKENGCLTDKAMLEMSYLVKDVIDLGDYVAPPKDPPLRATLRVVEFSLNSILFEMIADPSIGGNPITSFKLEWDYLSSFDSERNCAVEKLCINVDVPIELQTGSNKQPLKVTLQYPLSNLPPEEHLFAQVTASDGTLFGLESTSIVAKTASHPPAVQVNITSQSVISLGVRLIAQRSEGGNGVSHIKLEWDLSSDFSSERNCVLEILCLLVNTSNIFDLQSGTSFVIVNSVVSGLKPGTTYFVRASAYDNVAYGSFGVVKSGSTAGPPQMQDVGVSEVKETSVLVSFRTVESQNGLPVETVTIFYSKESDFELDSENTESVDISLSELVEFREKLSDEIEAVKDWALNRWAWRLTDLNDGTQYYLAVAASDIVKRGDISTTRIFKTPYIRIIFELPSGAKTVVMVLSVLVGVFLFLCLIGLIWGRK